MCGIVGYIGKKKAEPILINGLLRLEYRGYDSAGIATMEAEGIKTIKNKGRVAGLLEIPETQKLEGTVGIAHTRWATHGKPTDINSHPHMDNQKTTAVVHNGIIENYVELKKFLNDNGYEFLSQTDTEVIPNLIHYYYEREVEKNEMAFLRSMAKAVKDLKGSFAIEVLNEDFKDKMFVIRKDSPLVIGKGEGENYISSDIPAILSFTKDFYLLDDYEFAVLSKDNIEFYDLELSKIFKQPKNITWDMSAAEKGDYADFMLKEIFEQPKSIRETIGARITKGVKTNLEELDFTKEYLNSLDRIYIVACGTAMHAGLAVRKIIEKYCRIQTEVDIASEFRYRNPLVTEKSLCIFISQSGETADTIAALKLAKAKGAKTIAISNVIGSSITNEADYSLYTHAGPEIAVASTKAYTSQIVLLAIIAIYFAELLDVAHDEIEELKSEILELPSKVEEVLRDTSKIKAFANRIFTEKNAFFIGRGIDSSVAMEGALKLKEISYIHSEAYAAGELKHGPIALIENGVTVVGIMTDEDLAPKTVSNLQEVITRGAKTFIVTNQELEHVTFDEVIRIPRISKYISPVLSVIPLQLLAYYISKEKGLDVDKPRNLAKSVTVE
ncbi:MAG: glutamine--fructose-6-phosphate transaminase (isomerizing) [Clostridia bacterium]|nr:glutamine--fructose-6-phosphate transaminase (isomerizing) [Clostridia bacterium]